MSFDYIDIYKFGSASFWSLMMTQKLNADGLDLVYESPWMDSHEAMIHILCMPLYWPSVVTNSSTRGWAFNIVWIDDNNNVLGKSVFFAYGGGLVDVAANTDTWSYSGAFTLPSSYGGMFCSVLGIADKQVNSILTSNSLSYSNAITEEFMLRGVLGLYTHVPASAYKQASNGLSSGVFPARKKIRFRFTISRGASNVQSSVRIPADLEIGTFLGG